MELVINGYDVCSEKQFHDALVHGLALPSWYGKNLDALWDVLTGMVDRPLKITWVDSQFSKEQFPQFENIVSLLRDVQKYDAELGREDAFVLELA